MNFKKIMGVVLGLLILFYVGNTSYPVNGKALTYSDVKQTDWFEADLQALYQLNPSLFVGYPDGTFKPGNYLSVEAFIKVLVLAAKIPINGTNKVWSIPYLESALSVGIIQPDEWDDFTRPITREEVALLSIRVVDYMKTAMPNRSPEKIQSLIRDFDAISTIKQEMVVRAYDMGILTGYPNGKFMPKNFLKRSEALVVLRRIIDVNYRKQPDINQITNAEGTYQPVLGYKDNSPFYQYQRNTFPIGGGVDGVIDYSRSNIFVDLMQQVEGFGLPDSPWIMGSIQIDSQGWPLEDFGVMLMRDQFNIQNAGVYKMSFYCDGIPTIQAVASDCDIENLKRDSSTGLVTGDIVIKRVDQLFLSFENTMGGVRQLKIIRPGYNGNQTFTDEYLAHMDRFSVIRYMDFTRTNGNTQVKWSDRKIPLSGPKGPNQVIGQSWEYAIELSNTVKADMWINIPHMADQSYIRELALLIKHQLDPELNVYVEYSNEDWNWMFDQAHWTLSEANKEPNLSKLSYDGEKNQYYLHWRFIGEKIKNCSDIFGDVFGKSAINKRVRPVLAGQIVNDITYTQPLAYIAHTYGDPSQFIYGIAGAPYFNLGEKLQQAEGVTVDQMLSAMSKNIDDGEVYFENLRNIAIENGMKMLAYEGGPDTFGPGSIDQKEALQKDKGMKSLIIKYLENWYYAGGDVFCWYVAGPTSWHSQYGAWGLINTPGEDSGPKIEAIDTIINGGMSKYVSGKLPEGNPTIGVNATKKVIDFEKIADTGIEKNLGNELTYEGFTFNGTSGLSCVEQLSWTTDYKSNVLHGFGWGSLISVKNNMGYPFSLESVVLHRPYNTEQSSYVKITGKLFYRGSLSMVVKLPEDPDRQGYKLVMPDEWRKTGMKEIRFEFVESELNQVTRFGGIDDMNFWVSNTK